MPDPLPVVVLGRLAADVAHASAVMRDGETGSHLERVSTFARLDDGEMGVMRTHVEKGLDPVCVAALERIVAEFRDQP